MHRIDDISATVDNLFTEGDLSAGIPATTVTADWLNSLQEEVANVVEGAGITLEKEQQNQLFTALSFLTQRTVADAKGAANTPPQEGQSLFISSSDGGVFVAKTGAVAGTYISDGNGYCGTIIAFGNGSSAWVRQSVHIVNVRWFGAVGDGATDDTAAIDTAFAYIDSNRSRTGTPVNGARKIFLQVGGLVLYFDNGEYVYSGTGYTPRNNKVIILKGNSPASSMIRITSDTHLIHPTDSSKVMNYVELSDIKIVGGRGAFFNEKTDRGNVQLGKRVINCVFSGYTSVAFGSIQEADARWEVKRSVFEGGNKGTPVGLLLPHEVAGPDISGGNTFAGNKYDIITANDGISEIIIGPSNTFFNIVGRKKEADIWLIPNDYRQGVGTRLFGNRHSNENLDSSDPNILIADRDDTTPTHVFSHSTTVTTKEFNGLTINLCGMSGVGNPVTKSDAVGYIYSYSSRVGGLRFIDNTLGQWRPYIIEYAPGIRAADIDAGHAFTNYARLTTGRSPVNKYGVKGMSNIPGAGLIEYDNKINGGLPGALLTYSDGTVGLQNIHTTSTARGWRKGVSVIETDITDNAGGTTAATFTFGADQAVVASVTHANIKPGQILWVEADVKNSELTPLDNILMEYELHGGSISYQITLTDDWQRIRIPLICASGSHTRKTFSIQFAPRIFLNIGRKDSFDIGRFAAYHSQGPVNYSLVHI